VLSTRHVISGPVSPPTASSGGRKTSCHCPFWRRGRAATAKSRSGREDEGDRRRESGERGRLTTSSAQSDLKHGGRLSFGDPVLRDRSPDDWEACSNRPGGQSTHPWSRVRARWGSLGLLSSGANLLLRYSTALHALYSARRRSCFDRAHIAGRSALRHGRQQHPDKSGTRRLSQSLPGEDVTPGLRRDGQARLGARTTRRCRQRWRTKRRRASLPITCAAKAHMRDLACSRLV
jgi:hypothetical protein